MLGIRPDQIARVSLSEDVSVAVVTLMVCKKVLDNFDSKYVQNFLSYDGSKNISTDGPYKRMLIELIDHYSEGIMTRDRGAIIFMNNFLLALKENEKIQTFHRKREELRALKEKVRELENEVGEVE